MTETNQSTVPCFGNDSAAPDDLTPAERDFWARVIAGRASVWVPADKWLEIRNATMRDLMQRRARGVR